ncbi:unnamed protein product [Dracunculus medinensis]|uniref:Membrane transporter protein n=1 Tax=Dracunculus medinensis TaxID=318479 RepID=A0A3P7SHW5_DRAME|nr:unnamed protein product [Dracunculus medinensis]
MDHIEKSHDLKDARFIERLLAKHRRLLGVLIPFMLFQIIYWLLAYRYKFLYLFREKYIMSLIMIFGGLIGGMTTEGGGAVAFPAMTLVLHIDPTIARDFSLMIQSCGLSAAAFTIFFMSIVVEWYSIIFSSLGAIFGIIVGLEVIDQRITPPQKKMAFVSIFFSFALALFILNSEKKRIIFDRIQNFSPLKATVLVVNGFFGGILTAVTGSGIDIYSFSILTLLFRINEKVATPTSVVLMFLNSIAGFFWRQFIQQEISKDAWEYFAVCVPVVVLCAPTGSFLASHFHRLVLANLIYFLEIVALGGAIIAIKPEWGLILLSLVMISVSFVFYYCIGRIGRNEVSKYDAEKTKTTRDTMHN